MFAFLDMIIVRPIVNILFVIYSLVGDFGLAIILFTIIVKLLTWPLMKRQLHQTKAMRELQPELAEIKKNCKGNRQLESIQMMDLYKRKNVKPFRSMLMLLIQFPIFIGLFTAINVAVRPRITNNDEYTVQHSAYFFVEPMNHINDLITQQNTYLAQVKSGVKDATLEFKPKLFGIIDLSVTAGFDNLSTTIIFFFAVLSAAMQFVMARQQNPTHKKDNKRRTFRSLMKEAADGKEASQDEINAVAQGQMTWMMPLMMFMIMVNLPGALVFYYLLNNITTVVQQKLILNSNYTEMEAAADKQILKELKEAQEAVIVDDRTTKKEVKTTHYASDNRQNKNEKVHITRIKASDKKKRR